MERLLALCLRVALLGVAVVLVASACSGDGDESAEESAPSASPTSDAPTSDDGAGETTSGSDDEAPGDTGATTVSFSADVLPIIEGVCARCHTEDGPGTSHLRLDSVGDVAGASTAIAAAVGGAVMPPWPASDASIPFFDNWSLPAADRDAVVEWASSGGGVDTDPDRPIVSTAGVDRLDGVDLVLTADRGYDGAEGQPDEYRCFVYDPGFTEDRWILGYEFVPDNTEVVHHAIGYLVDGSRRERAAELEAEDPDNGGWSCFGGSRLGQDDIFLGWAPGQRPGRFPDGSGLRVGADDFIVVQVHYHFDTEAPEDFSALHLDLARPGSAALDEVVVLEFVAPAEIPCAADEEGPLCDRRAAFDAAVAKYGREGVQADGILGLCGQSPSDFAAMTDGTASSQCDHRVGEAGQLVGVLGHEHEIGASFRMTLNPDTPEELVLLDIPRWDFDWQFNYVPLDDIRVEPSDIVRIECAWDRSLRRPDLEPAYVLWADGTNDEMCFSTITVRRSR